MVSESSGNFEGKMSTEDNFDMETNVKEQIESNDVKNENNPNNMDSNVYGLVEDVFLVNEFNPNFPDIIGGTPSLYSIDDDMKETMNSTVTEKKPFESFEKQITISVPQPPPLLSAESFSIGGSLFHGKY